VILSGNTKHRGSRWRQRTAKVKGVVCYGWKSLIYGRSPDLRHTERAKIAFRSIKGSPHPRAIAQVRELTKKSRRSVSVSSYPRYFHRAFIWVRLLSMRVGCPILTTEAAGGEITYNSIVFVTEPRAMAVVIANETSDYQLGYLRMCSTLTLKVHGH
jgi:hypothetical protein